jgi:hypothetical protein
MAGPALLRVIRWWEVRRVYSNDFSRSERLCVFRLKNEALKYLRELRRSRKAINSRVISYKLCRTTETTEYEYRKD